MLNKKERDDIDSENCLKIQGRSICICVIYKGSAFARWPRVVKFDVHLFECFVNRLMHLIPSVLIDKRCSSSNFGSFIVRPIPGNSRVEIFSTEDGVKYVENVYRI